MRMDRASRNSWGTGGLEGSGALNSVGLLTVRFRTEGLGGERTRSVGLGGEGAIVGCRWCGREVGNAQGALGRSLGCRLGGLFKEDWGRVGYSR